MLQGRYGNDYLNRALCIASLVLMLINLFVPVGWARSIIQAVSLLLIIAAVLRMFSRNFVARRRENDKFIKIWMPVQSKINGFFRGRGNQSGYYGQNGQYYQNTQYQPRAKRAKKARVNPTFEERRKYKYFSCTQCAQKLRVPRGKGKLRVTCTRCGNKFEIKS